jgi:hypothetical protein
MPLSDEIQAGVVRMARAGRPPAVICAAFGLTKGQVSGIIFRARQTGSVKPTAKPVPKRRNWTPEDTVKIKRLWNEGASATEIAKELGVQSRCAVIGVIHRLKGKGQIEVRRAKNMRSRASYGFDPVAGLPIPAPRADDTARIAFADLERHHCRFICCAEAGKAVAAGDKLYCGDEIVPGTSYCAGHLARVSRDTALYTPKQLAWLEERRTKAAYRPAESLEEIPA